MALTFPREVIEPPSGILGGNSNKAVMTISILVVVLVVLVLIVLGLFIWGMRSGRCLPDKFIESRLTIDDTGSLNVMSSSTLTVNIVKKIAKQTQVADKHNLPVHKLTQQVIKPARGPGRGAEAPPHAAAVRCLRQVRPGPHLLRGDDSP